MGHGGVTWTQAAQAVPFQSPKSLQNVAVVTWQVIASVHMTSSKCLELSNGTGAVARRGTLWHAVSCPGAAVQRAACMKVVNEWAVTHHP